MRHAVVQDRGAYSDGKVSRWIDLPEEGQPEPENPAPTITLKPAANQAEVTKGSTPSSLPSTAASSTAAAATLASTSVAEQTAGTTGSGGSRGAWWIALAVAVIAGAGGLLLWRKRRSNQAP
jgi:LPXTG-motif cell wall-anchored protein